MTKGQSKQAVIDGPALLPVLALTSSVLTLSVISWDRLLAVYHPLRVYVVQQRCLEVIFVIWLISAVVSAPLVVYRKLVVVYVSSLEIQFKSNYSHTQKLKVVISATAFGVHESH